MICNALVNPQYATLSTGIAAAQTEFSADWPNGIVPTGQSAPKNDPISGLKTEPCGVFSDNYEGPVNSHGRGLTQLGANRWARGDRCGTANLGSVPYSVQLNRAEQILTHYYSGIQIRNVSNQLPVLPDKRWVPLKFDWGAGAVKPPVFVSGSNTSATFSVQIQNTGTVPWTCVAGSGVTYQLGYRWGRITPAYSQFSASTIEYVPSANRVDVCNVAVGASATYTFTVNNVPAWSGSVGTGLYFDIYQGIGTPSGDISSFRTGNPSWSEYIQPVQICTTTTCPRRTAVRDVVFVIDTTKSMVSYIDNVKAAAISEVNALASSGDNYRVALVEYREYSTVSSGDIVATVVLNFSSNPITIGNAINGLGTPSGTVSYNRTEVVYSGLMRAITMPWRSTADKRIMLFGDEPPVDPEVPNATTTYTAQSVIAAANAIPLHIDTISILNPAQSVTTRDAVASAFSNLTSSTGANLGSVIATTEISTAVQSISPMQAPVADAGGPYSAPLGSSITLSAPRSFDPNGVITRYEWDLNNDGVFEEVSAGPNLTYIYSQPYSGTITVRVADDSGNSTSDTTNVRVQAGMLPVSYAPVATLTGVGISPYTIKAADFNSDGILDLATGLFGSSNGITIALGNGNGTFQTPLFTATPYRAFGIAIGDLNGDQRPDIVVSGVSILLSNGNGTFQISSIAVGATANPGDVALSDMTGDGKLDILAINRANNTIALLRGNGDGTFQAAQSYTAGVEPYRLVIGDFNQDGWQDSAALSAVTNSLYIFLNNGNGGLLPRVEYAVGFSPVALDAQDINNDQIVDLVTANNGGLDMSILIGRGDGTFQTQPPVPISTSTVDVALVPIDSDSNLDLVAIRDDNQISIQRGNGDGTFQAASTFSLAGSIQNDTAFGDFNGDGRLDIATANSLGDTVSILLSTITISSTPPTPTPTATALPTSTPIPSGGAVVALDTFSRTISNGWGNTDGNFAWAAPANNSANYAVAGGVGQFTIPLSNTARELVLNTTNSPSVRDVDISVRVAANKLPPSGTSGEVYFTVIARQVSSGNRYRGVLRLTANGSVKLQAQNEVGGVNTQIGATQPVPGLTVAANGVIRMRVQVSGINQARIRMRAWADGTAEPTTWLIDELDTNNPAVLQAAGAIGLRGFLNSTATNVPIVVSYDDLVVTDLAAAGPTATPVPPTATPAAPTPTPLPGGSGLIAAYNFNAGAGTTLADATGLAHTGTLVGGPTWTTLGKNGNALTFDGTNDIVTIADANDLDLTTGMTLEAWVYPTASGWKPVIFKAQIGQLCYALYGDTGDINRPRGYIYRTVEVAVAGTAALPLNTWSHIATTYDGSNLRFYLNGVLIASQVVTGSIATSTGGLSLGGNTVWGEYFAGHIDDVRIYNRALSIAEIITDRNAPVP